jgi:hypothetical protein
MNLVPFMTAPSGCQPAEGESKDIEYEFNKLIVPSSLHEQDTEREMQSNSQVETCRMAVSSLGSSLVPPLCSSLGIRKAGMKLFAHI